MWVVLGLVSVALAVDANSDGCEDVQFADNGACVHDSSSVDPAANVGARATIGPNVDVEAGAGIGSSVSIAGRDDGPATLVIGAGTQIGRRTTLGFDSQIGGGTVASGVTIGEDFTATSGATIGYGAVIGNDVSFAVDATVGNLVQLGNHVDLSDYAVVGRKAVVHSTETPLERTTISGHVGPNTTVGAGSTVHGRMRRGSSIGAGSTVALGARVGRDATVGAGATLAAGAVVKSGGNLCGGEDLGIGETVSRGETYPASGCIALGAPGNPGSSCEAIRDADATAVNGPYTVTVGAGTRLVYCDLENDGGGWTLGVNIETDLTAIDLLGYNNQHANHLSLDYGVKANDFPLTSATEYRLTCVDGQAGGARKMFIRGLNPAEPIFQAAGTITTTNIECSQSQDFSSPETGGACLHVDNAQHTYYGVAAWDISWALYISGAAYTLRHCQNLGNGYHSSGELWFR